MLIRVPIPEYRGRVIIGAVSTERKGGMKGMIMSLRKARGTKKGIRKVEDFQEVGKEQ